METVTANKPGLFPPTEKGFQEKLFMFGLFAYSISCNFSITASQISLGLSLIALILMFRQGKVGIEKTPLDTPFAFFAFTGLLSLFYAIELVRGITEMKKFLIILVFYLAYWVKFSEVFQKKILTTYLASASVISVIGVLQLVFKKVIHNRPTGFFSMAMTFGECQAMAAVLAVGWLLYGENTRKQKTLLFLALGLSLTSLGLSLTRGAWLGFLTGIFILLVKFPRKLLPIILILGLASIPVVLSNETVKERFTSMDLSKNISEFSQPVNGKFSSLSIEANFRRLYIWKRGFTMVEMSPAFGVGMNNVKHWYKKLATDFERENDLIFGHQHNNFMQMLTMNGLLGLTGFCFFLVAGIKWLAKKNFCHSPWHAHISQTALAIFCCFFATGLTEYSWGDEEVAMLAFFLVGILMNSPDPEIPVEPA